MSRLCCARDSCRVSPAGSRSAAGVGAAAALAGLSTRMSRATSSAVSGSWWARVIRPPRRWRTDHLRTGRPVGAVPTPATQAQGDAPFCSATQRGAPLSVTSFPRSRYAANHTLRASGLRLRSGPVGSGPRRSRGPATTTQKDRPACLSRRPRLRLVVAAIETHSIHTGSLGTAGAGFGLETVNGRNPFACANALASVIRWCVNWIPSKTLIRRQPLRSRPRRLVNLDLGLSRCRM